MCFSAKIDRSWSIGALVNMLFFAHPVYLAVIDTGPWPNPLDQVASLLIAFFVQGKFFTLFSLLFGLGLAIQLQRSQDEGVSGKLQPLRSGRAAEGRLCMLVL